MDTASVIVRVSANDWYADLVVDTASVIVRESARDL